MPHAYEDEPTICGVPLKVNDDLLKPSEVALLHQSSPSEPLEDLRARYERDGYLLVKGLLPREDVLAAREAYFKGMSPSGVLKQGSDPVEGIFNPDAAPADYPGIGAGSVKNSRPGDTEKSAVFAELALEQHTAPWYAGSEDSGERGFANHPALKEFVAKFTKWGDDTLPVKRSLLRNNTPGNKAIGVHYDQTFMRHGEPTSVTAWVPIGDVRLDGGGLIYLDQGEQLGAEIEQDFSRKAREAGLSEEETKNAFNSNMMASGFLCDGPAEFGRRYGRKWLVTEYEAGDVVFHSPHMIHASTINYDTEGRIRLGTDLRFVNSARPWDKRWNNHYCFGDGV
ncbi:hypothetical protein N3K66_003116 [Trichothecium roseum]|uniref:Uncharacterized protein n=1 Tax=Trichothecium roseum TaxID=47278 RepID=A0ACC0V4D6_9HYPO|nr:hypothetical protein N3K66_003116 [Trichothecium roseum]